MYLEEYKIKYYDLEEVYNLVYKKFSNSKRFFSVRDVMGYKDKWVEDKYNYKKRRIDHIGRGLAVDSTSKSQVRIYLKRLCFIGILKKKQRVPMYLFRFERKWEEGDSLLLEKAKENAIEKIEVRFDEEELSQIYKRLNKLEEENKVINQYLKIISEKLKNSDGKK